jgi:hypothetical protein
MQLRALDRSFPAFIRRMEAALRSGELDPHNSHISGKEGLICEADTRGSCGYVYVSVYPAPAASIKEAEMPVPIEHLNGLWRELKNIAVIEEEGVLVIRDAFIHFPPVRRSWISGSGSKTATARSWLPGCCTADITLALLTLIPRGFNMKNITAPATVPVSPCLSPVQVWQTLLTYLLNKHYGLTLMTHRSVMTGSSENIDAGITLVDAVNFLAERHDLVRTDRRGFSGWNSRRF